MNPSVPFQLHVISVAMILMNSLWNQHTSATVEAFLIPLLIIVITAALTVTGQIYHASAQNPARSLRYE